MAQMRNVIEIGGAGFSKFFFFATIFTLVSGFCSLVSFASPYWSQSYPSTHNNFKNIGLWEACFFRYVHWKDDNQKPHTGCFWFWSPDMIKFRDWLMPGWFISVQIFASLAFICIFFLLAILSVSFLTSLRNHFTFMLCASILSFVGCVSSTVALIIYGVNGDNREWMPRPEFNVYSWGYWFQLASAFFQLIATPCFFAESQEIYEFNQRTKKSNKNKRPSELTVDGINPETESFT